MKLSLKKRTLLVQAMYALRAHSHNIVGKSCNDKTRVSGSCDTATTVLRDVFSLMHIINDELMDQQCVDVKDKDLICCGVEDVVSQHGVCKTNVVVVEKESDISEVLSSIILTLIAKQDIVDTTVIRYLKRDWQWQRVSNVVKMILRLGAYEIMFTDNKVNSIIPSYVRLSRKFGHFEEAKFINAVLDKINKEYRGSIEAKQL